MRRRAAWLLMAALALAQPSAARAQGADAAEIEFWKSAQHDDTADAYRAYLQAFPNGAFASLARRRIAQSTAAPAAPAEPPPARAPAQPSASIRPAKSTVRRVDGIVLDVDATGLGGDSNWRIAVVPADWPDGPPPDRDWFLANSIGIPAARLHLTIPSGPPGRDEVRIYSIPRFADGYRVAARAPIIVEPGAPGAVLVRDLDREAEALGPIRFEAQHRAQPMLIEAAFLRIEPQTQWQLGWLQGTLIETSSPAAIIRIGQVGAQPDEYGSLREGLCLLPAGGAMLDRLARLNLGDPVLIRAVPTSWSAAGRSSPVLLDRCELVSPR